MAMECSPGQTAKSMKESTIEAKSKGKGCLPGPTARCTRVDGRRASSTGRAK